MDDILAALRAHGWRVNTLHESEGGVWSANFVRDKVYTSIGVGDTPREALENALALVTTEAGKWPLFGRSAPLSLHLAHLEIAVRERTNV